MKCNACWREIEGRGIATTCGHVFCVEDAGKILSSEATCPICEHLLSKSQMKAVDLNPSDEWISMAMAGIPPHHIMKSAFKGIAFWIGQKDAEAHLTLKKAMQLRQRHEQMQAKFMEKLEQVHTAYQKAMKRVQSLEQELDNLSKDKAELQDKYTEKSRQKRKLEEMYDTLRTEYENLKRSAIQPARKDSYFAKNSVHDMFSTPDSFEEPNSRPSPGVSSPTVNISPVTPGQADFWPVRSRNDTSNLFDVGAIQPVHKARGLPSGILSRQPTSTFKESKPPLFTPGGNNPSNALRNLLLSPMKRQASRLRPGFTT